MINLPYRVVSSSKIWNLVRCLFNIMCLILLFTTCRANCRKSSQEAELETVDHVVMYVINKNIIKTIFWNGIKILVEGFYRNVTFVNTILLPHMDRLKLTWKSLNGLSWKIREVNVIKIMLVELAAKYDMLYSTESPTFVMFLG